jgi:hypothetical protein
LKLKQLGFQKVYCSGRQLDRFDLIKRFDATPITDGKDKFLSNLNKNKRINSLFFRGKRIKT